MFVCISRYDLYECGVDLFIVELNGINIWMHVTIMFVGPSCPIRRYSSTFVSFLASYYMPSHLLNYTLEQNWMWPLIWGLSVNSRCELLKRNFSNKVCSSSSFLRYISTELVVVISRIRIKIKLQVLNLHKRILKLFKH